jgi:hypothetical protein
MARFLITYLTGHDEIIQAATVDYDPDKIQYLATDARGTVVAYIPIGNVLSVVRQNDAAVTG